MEIDTLGKVLVTAKIENLEDLYVAKRGEISTDQVRSIEVLDALDDTGATLLSMPRSLIGQLGLDRVQTRRARTTNGIAEFGIYSPVQLTIQDRDCIFSVAEVPEDCPVLIGQIALRLLDFVVDPVGQRLIGNPEHGGEHMIELY